MAYIGYDSRLHSRASRVQTPRVRVAGGRLAFFAASLVAWAGVVAAARAIF